MIYHYGITLEGAYHTSNDMPCQDAHYFILIDDNFSIGTVGDGLGSETHSDIASKIATKISAEYCAKNINRDLDKDSILNIIKESFKLALEEINKIASDNNDDVSQYDTTLDLAVYLDGNVYYGHSGDSGIIVLNEDGYYEQLTIQQKDDDDCVFPLCFGEEKWVFGYKERVCSILMATDGIFNTFFPSLLRNEDEKMYVALAHFFMSEDYLGFKTIGEDAVLEKMLNYVKNIPSSQVDDDITVLVMNNDSILPERLDDKYYDVPNWDELKIKNEEKMKRLLYPSLFDDNKPSNIKDSDDSLIDETSIINEEENK